MTRRPVTGWVLVGLVGLCFSTLAVVLLTIAQRTQVQQLRRYIRQQCVQRQVFDASAQQTRLVFRDYYLSEIEQERTNRSIDVPLRQQRIAAARTLITSLDDTLTKTVRVPCRP